MFAGKPPTHTAYAIRRESHSDLRWLEIGMAHIEGDANGTHEIFIDRLPTGGFSGHIHLSPIGVIPESPELQPVRPAAKATDHES